MSDLPTYNKPTELLADIDSHGIYDAKMLERCNFDTSKVPTFTVPQTIKSIKARGLGGELSPAHTKDTRLIYGWTTAEALASSYISFSSTAFGRGTVFRQCFTALKGADL